MGFVSLPGCVWPDPIDNTVINRYQESMAAKSPQARVQQDKLGLLRPPVGVDGPDLPIVKDPQTHAMQINLSLEQAVMRSLANSMDIRVVSFDPAISREEITKAAAAFDYTFFGGINYQKLDNQVNTPFGGGHGDIRTYTAGVKNLAVTGAQQQLAWTMTRTNLDSVPVFFNPSWTSQLQYQVEQPLLRDAGCEFNLAQMHIAQMNDKITRAQFRQKVEETVFNVISTYWLLAQARRDYDIQKQLLDATEATYTRVYERRAIDASDVQVKQAEAAVATRKANLIRAGKNILDAQDQLARLLSDSQINVLTDYEIIPVTAPVTTQVKLDVADQLMAGLEHSPILEQARWAIEAAAINVMVARNQTLPKLNLVASAGPQGLQPTLDKSEDVMWGGDFLSYSAGLQLEYPIGNRAREADLRSKRFARAKAITQLQQVADQMAVAVKERIRQVNTAYEEILAQRKVSQAAREQLAALDETEKTLAKLNPEFLNLKLQAQETVSNAERSELQAIINYNTAIIELYKVNGTILELHRIKMAMPVALGEAMWPAATATPTTEPWTQDIYAPPTMTTPPPPTTLPDVPPGTKPSVPATTLDADK